MSEDKSELKRNTVCKKEEGMNIKKERGGEIKLAANCSCTEPH